MTPEELVEAVFYDPRSDLAKAFLSMPQIKTPQTK